MRRTLFDGSKALLELGKCGERALFHVNLGVIEI